MVVFLSIFHTFTYSRSSQFRKVNKLDKCEITAFCIKEHILKEGKQKEKQGQQLKRLDHGFINKKMTAIINVKC